MKSVAQPNLTITKYGIYDPKTNLYVKSPHGSYNGTSLRSSVYVPIWVSEPHKARLWKSLKQAEKVLSQCFDMTDHKLDYELQIVEVVIHYNITSVNTISHGDSMQNFCKTSLKKFPTILDHFRQLPDHASPSGIGSLDPHHNLTFEQRQFICKYYSKLKEVL